MDNVTLFKKIFADRDRFAKPFKTYLDIKATLPKLSCTTEDLKKYSFQKESLKNTLTLLCVCEPFKPEIVKSAYECLKRNENDDYALLECEKEVNALNSTVHEILSELKENKQREEQVKNACSDTLQEFQTRSSDESAAKFHACFVSLLCANQMKRALNCVNKNHEELHGCETEIDDMLKCSIDKWIQHAVKKSNYHDEKNQSDNNNSDE